MKFKALHSFDVIGGDVVLFFIGDDDKKYQMSLDGSVATSLFAALLGIAKRLPPGPRPILDAPLAVQGAIGADMKPLISLTFSGNLEIALTATPETITGLREVLRQIEAANAPGSAAH